MDKAAAEANAREDQGRIIPKYLDGGVIGEGLVNWAEKSVTDSLRTMGMLTQGDSTSRLSLSNFATGSGYGILSNAPIAGSGAKALESNFYDPGSNSIVQQSGGERLRQGGLSVAEFALTFAGGMLGDGLAAGSKGIPGAVSASKTFAIVHFTNVTFISLTSNNSQSQPCAATATTRIFLKE